MFHSRCDAMIRFLKLQLEGVQNALEQERAANRAQEKKLTELVVNGAPRQTSVPLSGFPREIGGLTPPPRPDLELMVSEDLPPELFDAEHALYIGKDVVPDSWTPRHFSDPKTATGKLLRDRMKAREAAMGAKEKKDS